MRSVLEESSAAAQARADQLVRRAAGARGRPAQSVPGLNAGPANGVLGATIPGQSRGHAFEQARHFRGWFYAAVRPIAMRTAGQEVKVARISSKKKSKFTKRLDLPRSLKSLEGDRAAEVLPDHEIIQALDDPNSVMTRWALLYVTVASLKIWGRAYWWVRRREKGVPGSEWEIWPVPASWLEPIHTEVTSFAAWKITPPGATESQFIPREEVVAFHYPDPSDPLGSYSELQAIDRAVVTDDYIQGAQQNGFQRGIFPGWILTVGRQPDATGSGPGQRPVLTPEQRAQLIHAVKAYYRGVARFDEPMILDGLIESATKSTHSNTEMAYSESGKITKDRITEGVGTSPAIMGHLEGANRAASLVADEQFLNGTVNPLIDFISQTLTRSLGKLFARPGERLLVYLEPAVTTDAELELKQAIAAYDRGLLDGNSFLKRMGLPPIPGGNVCFIRPELVPYVIPSEDDPNPDFAANPFVVQFAARPKQPALPKAGNDLLTTQDTGAGQDAGTAE
jgi:phage portal protein BeeE